jgi:predicted CXXCH cytochrome family protein
MVVFEKKCFGLNVSLGLGCMALYFFLLLFTPVEAQNEKECLDCHPDYYEEFSGDFNHSPFEQEDCYACHKFHGFRNAMELIGPPQEVCGFCHETTSGLDEETTHFPVSDDDGCLICHNPHSSDSAGLLLLPRKQVCLECHDAPESDSEYSHPPYNDTSCVECHNPHGSPFGSFFLMPVEYLCLDCHTEQLGDIDPSEIHAGDQDGTCDKCHIGHNSSFKALLRKEPGQLCLDCHSSMKDKLAEAVKHTILEEDDCLACHKPHFQKSGGHLGEDGQSLCFTCHGDIEERMEAEVVHAAAEDDCLTCHDPHIRLNLEDEPELCGDCHDYSDDAFADRHLGLTPQFCSNCHDPHGSAQEKLIREEGHPPFDDRDCEICHNSENPEDYLQSNELCLDCHDIDENDEPHQKLDLANRGCIYCHFPHASPRKGLLRPESQR